MIFFLIGGLFIYFYHYLLFWARVAACFLFSMSVLPESLATPADSSDVRYLLNAAMEREFCITLMSEPLNWDECKIEDNRIVGKRGGKEFRFWEIMMKQIYNEGVGPIFRPGITVKFMSAMASTVCHWYRQSSDDPIWLPVLRDVPGFHMYPGTTCVIRWTYYAKRMSRLNVCNFFILLLKDPLLCYHFMTSLEQATMRLDHVHFIIRNRLQFLSAGIGDRGCCIAEIYRHSYYSDFGSWLLCDCAVSSCPKLHDIDGPIAEFDESQECPADVIQYASRFLCWRSSVQGVMNFTRLAFCVPYDSAVINNRRCWC